MASDRKSSSTPEWHEDQVDGYDSRQVGEYEHDRDQEGSFMPISMSPAAATAPDATGWRKWAPHVKLVEKGTEGEEAPTSFFRKTYKEDESYGECLFGYTNSSFTIIGTVVAVPLSIKRKSYHPLLMMTVWGSAADLFLGFLNCQHLKPGAKSADNVADNFAAPKSDQFLPRQKIEDKTTQPPS